MTPWLAFHQSTNWNRNQTVGARKELQLYW
jgi:hypothetical protein